MSIIFSQVIMLFVFIAIGFVLGKTKISKSEHSQILSSLLVYIFLPCNIFKTFSKNFTVTYIIEGYQQLIVSTVIILILLVLSHFVSKLFSKEKYEKCIYEYSLIVPNYGYMGYALAEALFGEAGLTNMMVFALPVSLYIYTIGFCKLTKRGFSLKKLCNPVMITTVIGIIAGLFGITVPAVLINVIEKASDCMAPVSMLLTGIVLSGFSFKPIICRLKNYYLTILRLIIIPLLIGFVLNTFCEPKLVQTAVLFYALPCGLNTIVFPKLVNENCEIGAGQALISTTFSCITLPIILNFFQ